MDAIVDSSFNRYGTPSAVIHGEEFSVSAAICLRYGRGTLEFSDGRSYPVYWRGPTAGVDVGATGVKSFALNYMQRGNIIIAPMRVGFGYQVGISLVYLKFSTEGGWWPF
jgi:hypothetical protein